VSLKRVEEIKNDKITLHNAFSKTEEGFTWVVTTSKDLKEQRAIRTNSSSLDTELLPVQGVYLNHR
jgi:hypothetical protein